MSIKLKALLLTILATLKLFLTDMRKDNWVLVDLIKEVSVEVDYQVLGDQININYRALLKVMVMLKFFHMDLHNIVRLLVVMIILEHHPLDRHKVVQII